MELAFFHAQEQQALCALEALHAKVARRLGQSPASVTRAVAALEERLGARLLRRTTRVVRLTEAGARYLVQAKRILAELEEADGMLQDSGGELSGELTVTASMLFGRIHVTPIILAFLARHPRVRLRALFSDSVLDLPEHNVDVAIRIAELPDSALHARRVGTVRRVVCAAPSYLRAHGTPREPRQLSEHALIAFSGTGERARGASWSTVRSSTCVHTRG